MDIPLTVLSKRASLTDQAEQPYSFALLRYVHDVFLISLRFRVIHNLCCDVARSGRRLSA
jgi:hypothetical protein